MTNLVNGKEFYWELAQEFILGPLFFNIFLCDLFFFTNGIDIATYADDNTPYVSENRPCKVIEQLDTSNNLKTGICGVTVASSLERKLPGLIIDNQLTFKSLKMHANQKLNALTRITSYWTNTKEE